MPPHPPPSATTIRDAVQAQALMFSSLGLLGLAAAPAVLLFVPRPPLAWLALPLAVAGLACALRPFLLRCPRCRRRFRLAIGKAASFPGAQELDECPGCHCNLDDRL